jgi:DNA-binding NtrC family response regulator
METSLDGLDCLEKLRRVEPAVLELDPEVRWGGGDGVLAWMREESLMPCIPVILTATAGYPKDFAEFIEPPVVDYLPKPFALNALLESVRSVVEEKGRGEPSKLNRVPADWKLLIG